MGKLQKKIASDKARENLLKYKADLLPTKSLLEVEVKPIQVHKAKKRKKNKPKKIENQTYQQYITSKAWLRRRIEFYKKFGRKCAVCGSKKIHVHHISYRHLGREPDEDLIGLCETHHKLFHEEVRMKVDMRGETHDFIAKYRKAELTRIIN